VFTPEELLTAVTIYWVTRTFGTSVRWYLEAARDRWRPSHDRSPLVEASAGVTILTAGMPPGSSFESLNDAFDVRFTNFHERGGHFAPAENPNALIEDLRSAFRSLR
jgi:hypothetical protein